MTDPIRKSVTVPLRPDAAFRLFTDGFGDWWPAARGTRRAANGNAPRKLRVTPGKGGHIEETKPDGEVARWGTILRWQPGAALGIAWNLGMPEDEASEVWITFTPVDTGTRVDLTHTGIGQNTTLQMSDCANGWSDRPDSFRILAKGCGFLMAA